MKTFNPSSEENVSKTLDLNFGDVEKMHNVLSADTDYMILDDDNDGDAEIINHGWPKHEDYMMLDDMTLTDMILDDKKLDESINNMSNNPLRTAIGLDIKPYPIAKDRKATRPGLKGFGGCTPSTKNRKIADPKTRPCKPSNEKVVITREVRRQPLPSIPKGPNTTGKKPARVVPPPPVIPKATSGVSKAALNYNASDRIKNLAKPRSLPKMETIDKHLCSMGKSKALAYKPSLRIQQLALPRNRIEAKNSSTLQDGAA